ncbi:MAG: hypothetical protein KBA61_06740 [Spirochaetes bacterium]|nr:hypothetical protein [Spirochaetota bacterium]
MKKKDDHLRYGNSFFGVSGADAKRILALLQKTVPGKTSPAAVRNEILGLLPALQRSAILPSWLLLEEPVTVPQSIVHLAEPLFSGSFQDEDEFYSSDPPETQLVLDEFGNAKRFPGASSDIDNDQWATTITARDIPDIRCYNFGVMLTGITWFENPPHTLAALHSLMKKLATVYEGEMLEYEAKDIDAPSKKKASSGKNAIPAEPLPPGREGEILALLKKYTIFRGRNEDSVEALYQEALTLPSCEHILSFVLDVYRHESTKKKFITCPGTGRFLAALVDQGAGERIEALVREVPNRVTMYLIDALVVFTPKERVELRRRYYQLLLEFADSQSIPEDARKEARYHADTIAKFTPV